MSRSLLEGSYNSRFDKGSQQRKGSGVEVRVNGNMWSNQVRFILCSDQFQNAKGISEKVCLEVGFEGESERSSSLYLLGEAVSGLGVCQSEREQTTFGQKRLVVVEDMSREVRQVKGREWGHRGLWRSRLEVCFGCRCALNSMEGWNVGIIWADCWEG